MICAYNFIPFTDVLPATETEFIVSSLFTELNSLTLIQPSGDQYSMHIGSNETPQTTRISNEDFNVENIPEIQIKFRIQHLLEGPSQFKPFWMHSKCWGSSFSPTTT